MTSTHFSFDPVWNSDSGSRIAFTSAKTHTPPSRRTMKTTASRWVAL
jgi:hypothetical protein